MSLKCAVVGLPNVGKSTFFNAISQAGAQAANYPFCTIEPNVGMVSIPDLRLQQIAEIAQSQVTIPTHMEFVDIAGLVKGAASGEGLGNQFLSHIREAQAICHVVRCFADKDITHVSGAVNPLDDLSVIDTELCLADLQTVENALKKAQSKTKAGNKHVLIQIEALKQFEIWLNDSQSLRNCQLSETMLEVISQLHLLTAKPLMLVANVDEDAADNEALESLKQYAEKHHTKLLVISAKIESELAELPAEEKNTFLKEMGYAEPGLNRVIRAAYDLLNLHTFFTAGPKEARAWTIKKGADALTAAGVIHTDFMQHFIRAEVVSFKDYIECQGELGAKNKGLWRLEGKSYVVIDGDVVYFRTSA